MKIPVLLAFLIFLLAFPLGADVDVMFREDFENLTAGSTPDLFQPSGSANPDWDNALSNPLGATVTFNQIDTAAVAGNASNKYRLKTGTDGEPLLLGANISPSESRYFAVEYDLLLNANPADLSAADIYLSEGYDELDGTSATTRISVHLQFNDITALPDDNGGADGIYRTTGQDADVTTDDGNEWDIGVGWSAGVWHRVRLVLDQESRTFSVKVTDKSTGATSFSEGLAYNNSAGGFVRKVWFGVNASTPDMYLDNIIMYQGATAAPMAGPTITQYEYEKVPVNINTGMDVNFADDVDLQSVDYKIGEDGSWTPLSGDGTSQIDLSGIADTDLTAAVFVTDSDFAEMDEGENRIFFKAVDSDGYTAENGEYLVFHKDIEKPNAASVTNPNSATISSLPAISGLAADGVSGIPANSLTFTLRRTDDGTYWDGAAWQTGATQLPTTHPASTDATEVSWTNSGALPVLSGVAMEAQASVDDNLGNGIFSGSAFSFTVQSGYPEITLNVSSLDPVRNNTSAGIDVDFSDDIDLVSIQYSVDGGAWEDLRSLGDAPISLIGGADASWTTPVYMLTSDFNALAEGGHILLFRAIDSDLNITTTSTSVVFQKDTGTPSTASVTEPSADPFGSLPTIGGLIADNSGGQGIAADSTTFSIYWISDDSYWDGSSWSVGPISLPASHPATTDGSAVGWRRNTSLPAPADLTAGNTYTVSVTATDRAGNSTTNSVSLDYGDVPETASITDPVDGGAYNAAFSVQGYAADHEGGSGLFANSTTFTIRETGSGNYWNGAAWQVGSVPLPTTHVAATENQQVVWTPAGSLPGELVPSDLTDGVDYEIQATVTNVNLGVLTGHVTTITCDKTGPALSSLATADIDGDGYIDRLVASFDEPVDESTIIAGDFSISASAVAGVAGDWVSANETIWVNITDGILATDEVPTLTINAGGIEDSAGNQNSPATDFPSTDGAPPAFAAVETVDFDGNGYLDYLRITYSEAVDDTSVSAADFDIAGVSLETFDSVTPAGVANDSEIYIGFEDWTLRTNVTPSFDYTAGSLTDIPGVSLLSAEATASTDMAGPAILNASASDNAGIFIGIDSDDQVTLIFSEDTDQFAIAAGNIDTVMSLNNSHSWLDGDGNIGSAVWSNARTLVITLSTATSDPTVWAGDTITLDGASILDITGNVCSTSVFSAISGTFEDDTTSPSLMSLSTADADGDGFTDRLIAVFDEPVNEGTIIDSLFSVDTGTISGVSDDTVSSDAAIWVNLTDGELTTEAVPVLTVASGAVEDLPGNQNSASVAFASVDVAGPAIITAIAIPGEKAVYLAFSEAVTNGSTSVPASAFSYADAGNSIAGVTVLDIDGTLFSEVLISLGSPIELADIMAPELISVSPGSLIDTGGNNATSIQRRISDLAIGAAEPVWAANGTTVESGTSTARDFDGSESLGLSDVTIQVYHEAGETVEIAYDIVDSPSQKAWLPERFFGVDIDYNPDAIRLAPSATRDNLSTYIIPSDEFSDDASVEFVLSLGSLVATRIVNPKDPKSLSVWSFSIADIKRQKAGVTILNNVFNPSHGEETIIVYTVPEAGNVSVLVSDMKADLITVLYRGMRTEGEYNAVWDGKNRSGRIVAPGLYFIKVVGPGTNEIRKVLVVRNR